MQVVERVMKEKRSGPTTFEALGQVKNIVEGWCANPELWHLGTCDSGCRSLRNCPAELPCLANDDCYTW